MVAREARAAARAAEAASKAAQEAHAAAQSVLASLESASAQGHEWEEVSAHEGMQDLGMVEHEAESSGPVLVQSEAVIADFQEPGHEEARAEFAQEQQDSWNDGWIEPEHGIDHSYGDSLAAQTVLNEGQIAGDRVEEPIFANLIHFPREVIATRKLRPRRAEGPLVDEASETQLSIFEVDPGSISTEPAPANEPIAPAWMREHWAEIEREDQRQSDPEEEYEPMVRIAELDPAPLSMRLLASVVDLSLIAGIFLGVVALASPHLKAPMSLRGFEVVGVVSMLLIGWVYQAGFFALARTTPGMAYAGIGLSTFEGDVPDRAQHSRRLVAMLLSVLPLGLGLLWAFLDNDLLTWHDRLSSTYLRKL